MRGTILVCVGAVPTITSSSLVQSRICWFRAAGANVSNLSCCNPVPKWPVSTGKYPQSLSFSHCPQLIELPAAHSYSHRSLQRGAAQCGRSSGLVPPPLPIHPEGPATDSHCVFAELIISLQSKATRLNSISLAHDYCFWTVLDWLGDTFRFSYWSLKWITSNEY